MRHYGIRQYVGLLTLAPLFVLALVLEIYFLMHHFRNLDQGLLEKGELVIHQLASSSEYGVFSNNMEFLQSTAASALRRADVTGVLILDANSRILASAGDFSRAFRSEIIERSTANRMQFARIGDAGDAVVLHPAASDSHDLWLYRAIVPEQLPFDDFSGHTIKPVPTGSVILEISKTRHEQHKSQMLWATLIATLAFLAVTSYLINIASRKITRPIRKLSQAVQAIGAGRLDTRVDPETGVGELTTLAQGLNKTAGQLQREKEILQQRIEEATLALRAKKDEAERASQDKSRFLAVASHDLRQPLHALGLYVAELQNKLSGTPQQRLAEQIENSVESLSVLLNALLDISKLDAGAIVPQIRVYGMDAVLERIAADYQMLAGVKNIRLAVRPCGAFTISDPLLLERILSNLVSNAVRYTPQNGTVLVACRRRGKSLRVEVRDNGVGISKADQDNIFREFVQLVQPQLDTSKGLGLGLAIVDRLARLLGHRIELRSSPGRGAVFALEVPLAARPDGYSRGGLRGLAIRKAVARKAGSRRPGMHRRVCSPWGARECSSSTTIRTCCPEQPAPSLPGVAR